MRPGILSGEDGSQALVGRVPAAVGSFEEHAAGGQAVDVRGVRPGISVTAQVASPQRIGHDQDDVRSLPHFLPGGRGISLCAARGRAHCPPVSASMGHPRRSCYPVSSGEAGSRPIRIVSYRGTVVKSSSPRRIILSLEGERKASGCGPSVLDAGGQKRTGIIPPGRGSSRGDRS